ncbi:integrase catalytic domain-containing protein [Trichonephila clavipes]|uniref:Integrase catalytic domain-containing protein n=1 Tax=Trichonephila clavipes TaxID=2585209 RepID=A0A8X6V5F1_TRICX|nr:integrase catalytic domain-containing protein [Trichonephila clavipes]
MHVILRALGKDETRLKRLCSTLNEHGSKLRGPSRIAVIRKDGLVRTIKLKTQSCTLIRPIQRVFPLEVSGNDVANPPLQKVQQTYSSVNCPNPDTLIATEQPLVTRCGRLVKKPEKLNLLTLTDVFD